MQNLINLDKERTVLREKFEGLILDNDMNDLKEKSNIDYIAKDLLSK